MPLFQKSVINKHLQTQDKHLLAAQWLAFKNHFHNKTIQDNIRNSKEEEYQGEFLIDLFVNIFGYTKKPHDNFNLVTEQKNVKDSKKADGAIFIDQRVKAVIELKGTNTTDLNKIETQAFGYKNNQPDCTYVITSNFEKLRFYIDNATEHLEFNLFQLTETEFELLYLCLAYQNIVKDIPRKIKADSVSQEDVITKKLYKDYSLFKSELYNNLVSLNPDFEPIELFKKSQKLLDRFLFIFFAEDRNLLPTNLIFRINKEWKELQQMRMEVSLYDRYKRYFVDLNEGAKVTLPAFSQTATHQKEEHQIYAYNGGLFKPDSILDKIKIDDGVLFQHTEKLSHYDFQSEVDVNILGHIFENSLNEFDEVKANLLGENIAEKQTKRKKDGVFYTPKYITKYIVDSTIGKLCEQKKIEFEINDEIYQPAKQRSRKRIDNLKKYRDWLLKLTICDPACGSGAFLNQALEFLINEHRYIDELSAKYNKDTFVLFDVEISILENNLFGVDINEESVEIAKLSLWLRTAQTNRKLNDLSNNIKCGNSLIEEVAIAGESAFDWKAEFPKVFSKDGFDVIIGNPPYITFALGAGSKHDDLQTNHLKLTYKSANYKVSSYLIFFEKGIDLLNQNGIMSYIIPNTYHNNFYFKDFRELLITKTQIESLANLTFKVFDDAEMGFTSIPVVRKKFKENSFTSILDAQDTNAFLNSDYSQHSQHGFLNYPDNKFLFGKNTSIWNKANKKSVTLGDKIFRFYNGIKTGNNDKFLSNKKLEESYKPIISGKNFSRYYIDDVVGYINFLPKELWSNTNEVMFASPEKLIFRRTSDSLLLSYDDKQRFCLDTIHLLFCLDPNIQHKFLLAVLNSKLLNFLYQIIVPEIGKAFAEVKIVNLKKLPIKLISSEKQTPFVEKATFILSTQKDLLTSSARFQRTIERKFNINELPKKLQHWYLLKYSEFIKELTKKKVRISLTEEAEWEDYFNLEATKALQLKAAIDATDREVDQMVYMLYGLTSDEIAIVENS